MRAAQVEKELSALKRDVARLKKAVFDKSDAKVAASAQGPMEQYLEARTASAGEEVCGRKGTAVLALHLTARSGESGHAGTWCDTWSLANVMKSSPADVARFASLAANEHSAAVLRALCDEVLTVKEMGNRTGLSTGKLYPAVKGLALLGMVVTRGKARYALTSKGHFLAVMLFAMAASFHNPGLSEGVSALEEGSV